MPWTNQMEDKLRFVAEWYSGVWTKTQICKRFGISRKTGYKLIARYEEEGLLGLEDRSRVPKSCSHAMRPESAEALLELREEKPNWGPKKLLGRLHRIRPELILPSRSAVANLLKRNGLVHPKRTRKRWTHPGCASLVTTEPNEIWSTDFKGEFKTRDGYYCFPLTVTDADSRYILACEALASTEQLGCFPVFERLFHEFGLPNAIRTDNGNPFVTQALSGLSRLGVWWIKLGITRQRIPPASPGQNGRHERMHRVLKAETTRPPARDLKGQQILFNAFMHDYNDIRPHEALDQDSPGQRYTKSRRAYPEALPAPDYEGHWEIRRVAKSGVFRFKMAQVFISQTLAGEEIALEEVDDGVWNIYFYSELLARYDERTSKLHE